MADMAARDTERDELDERLRRLVPLNVLSPERLAVILNRAELTEIGRGGYVFRQGDRDGYAYYLLDGELEMYADGELVQHIMSGTERAAHALAQLQPRQLSARARTAVRVLRVEQDLLEGVLAEHAGVAPAASLEIYDLDAAAGDEGDWMARMLRSPLFARVPAANIQRIFTRMAALEVHAGDVVVEQGSQGDYYYVVQCGRCEVTRRTSATGVPIKLAELGPGDGFGEEALIAGARRNASVTMLTDGELMRLDKQDFLELIQEPLLRGVTLAEAQAEVAAGARWLDVRFKEEHEREALPGSVNLPLNILRLHSNRLERDTRYIVVCDTGQRAAVGAFLLVARGFDAAYVRGGMRAGAPDAPALEIIPEAAGAPPDQPAAPALLPRSHLADDELGRCVRVAEAADDALEADVRAETLRAELARANLKLEEALRLKEQAESTRRRAEQEAQERLRAERERLAEKARRAEEMLREAERLKAEIESAKRAADAEVEKRRRAEEERIRTLEAEAERRLAEERKRLEEAYRWKEEELERFEQLKAEAEAALAAERERLAAREQEALQRLAEARRIEREVEQTRAAAAEEAERRRHRQLELEQRLKEEIRTKIDTERRRLEAEFARNAEQLELARREKAAAEAARRAAAEEAERIIAEYQAAHERMRAAEEAKLAAERERLEREAAVIAAQREAARRAKEQAEQARAEAERRLAELERHASAAVGEDGAALRARLRDIDAEVSHADAELEAARAAQADNDARMREHRAAADELRERAEREVADWLRAQEEWQRSDLQREILANQRAYMERIKRRAEEVRRQAKAHDRSLLEDIAARLREGGD